MDTTSLNVGCGLIATAPVFAAHVVFLKEIRYILLAWFCSFVSTVLLIICSLSSLFTSNPWYILIFSLPFDTLGKIVLKYFGCKMKFLSHPQARISLGLSCGLGFALAHVLTMFMPMVFDQPFSVDFDSKHPPYFPNSLDLAFLNHAMSIFHMDIGLFIFRFAKVNIFLMYFIVLAIHFGMAALTQIPNIPAKLIVLFVISYGLLIFLILSYRNMEYEAIEDEPEPEPDTENDTEQQKKDHKE